MAEEKLVDEEVLKGVEGLGIEDLPPAGWKRDEVVKRRQDNLDEKADDLARRMMVGKVPEEMLQIDRDIAQKLDGLEVSNARDEYEYYWENFRTNNGAKIEKRKLLGWEVVTGKGKDSPEAQECIEADGTRRIGDVLLMRCKKERALYLKALARKESLERRGAMANPEYLAELALEHTGGKVVFHTDIPAQYRELAEQRAKAKALQIERVYSQVRAKYRRLGKALEGGNAIPMGNFQGVL